MILKPFAHHTPSPEGLAKIGCLRVDFSDLLNSIHVNCPDSRERALAITNLEQAAMWAVKSIVSNDPNSKAEGTG